MTEFTFTEAKLEGGWLMVKPSRSDLGKAMAFIQKMKAAPYDLSLKEHREKRSLSANSMMWAVLGEMARELAKNHGGVSPDDLYRGYIRSTGNYYVAECWEDSLPKLQKTWESNGTGWIAEATEPVDECDGMQKWSVRLWYGSSQYDSAEMSRLIDAVLQDAHAMGLAGDNITALMDAYPNGQ